MKMQEFLRLRRQQDAVKIIILYVIAICVCGGFVVRDGIHYAKAIRETEEFKLIGNSQILTENKVQKVRQIEGVTAVSYDLTSSVTVQYYANTAVFETEYLSRDYIQDVYGILPTGSTMTFYANPAAYRQIIQSLSKDSAPIKNTEITVIYQTENVTANGDSDQLQNSRTARIIQKEIGGDTPFICAVGEPVTLKTSGNLRIQVARQDQSQKVLALTSNLSFSNDNALEIYQAQAKLDKIFLQIKFELLLLAACLIAALAMVKYSVKPLEK